MKRPSHATVVAYLALFFAMSGTAYAATGGTFLLGKSNYATTTTGLTNTAGTPLKLAAKSGYAPLSVGTNKVRVPYFNADLLDGIDSTGLLRSTGTAANSSKLGGYGPSHFQVAGSLIGTFVLDDNFCPAGTSDYGRVQLSNGNGYFLCKITG